MKREGCWCWRKETKKVKKKGSDCFSLLCNALTFSMGKYSSSPQAVMEAGTRGLGLVVEMQKAMPASLRAGKTCSGPRTVEAQLARFVPITRYL